MTSTNNTIGFNIPHNLVPRLREAMVKEAAQSAEAIVDASNWYVKAWQEVEDDLPSELAERAAHRYDEWIAALRRPRRMLRLARHLGGMHEDIGHDGIFVPAKRAADLLEALDWLENDLRAKLELGWDREPTWIANAADTLGSVIELRDEVAPYVPDAPEPAPGERGPLRTADWERDEQEARRGYAMMANAAARAALLPCDDEQQGAFAQYRRLFEASAGLAPLDPADLDDLDDPATKAADAGAAQRVHDEASGNWQVPTVDLADLGATDLAPLLYARAIEDVASACNEFDHDYGVATNALQDGCPVNAEDLAKLRTRYADLRRTVAVMDRWFNGLDDFRTGEWDGEGAARLLPAPLVAELAGGCVGYQADLVRYGGDPDVRLSAAKKMSRLLVLAEAARRHLPAEDAGAVFEVVGVSIRKAEEDRTDASHELVFDEKTEGAPVA